MNDESLIVKYDLDRDVMDLHNNGAKPKEIATVLNKKYPMLPRDISAAMVAAHVKSLALPPSTSNKSGLTRLEKAKLKSLEGQLDLMQESMELYYIAKQLLDDLCRAAEERDRMPEPHRFKAVFGELREMMKDINKLQVQAMDYSKIMEFITLLFKLISRHAPDVLPLIVRDLSQESTVSWFTKVFGGNGGAEAASPTYDVEVVPDIDPDSNLQHEGEMNLEEDLLDSLLWEDDSDGE